jgi:flagellin-like protein
VVILGVGRMLKKRGVSPIVATLLLILIAIAAAAVLYVWVNSLSSSATQYNSGNVGVAISIDAADLSKRSVTLYVRNVGSSNVNGVLSVYVYDQNGTLVASGQTGSVSLTTGQVQQVSASLTPSNSIVSGKVYTIKIVAPSGASAVTSTTAHE